MKTVSKDHEFILPGYCPYCQGVIHATTNDFEEDQGAIVVTSIDIHCPNAPANTNIEYGSPDYDYSHTRERFRYWIPTQKKILSEIRRNYRFFKSDIPACPSCGSAPVYEEEKQDQRISMTLGCSSCDTRFGVSCDPDDDKKASKRRLLKMWCDREASAVEK